MDYNGGTTTSAAPYSNNNSRRTIHDSVSSTDSNTIVLQAALSELHRSNNDSHLVQEALESVGDLNYNAAAEVNLELKL